MFRGATSVSAVKLFDEVKPQTASRFIVCINCSPGRSCWNQICFVKERP